jgi:hypothetical protein
MNGMTQPSRRTRLARLAGAGALVTASGIVLAGIATQLVSGNIDYSGLTDGPATMTYRELVTPVGETTGGWHYHPGNVYNVVEQGTITVEDGCGGIETFSAGQAFEKTDGRVHRAYNLGSVDVIEHSMFINSPGRPLGVGTPGNQQRCGPARSVDECLNGGWMQFDHPQPFASQGACIAYVNNRPTRTILIPADPLP